MKLSEIRACDSCRGPLVTTQHPDFYVVRVSAGLPKPQALRSIMATARAEAGSVTEADAIIADADVVRVLANEPGMGGWAEALVCRRCFTTDLGALSLQGLMGTAAERRTERNRGAHGHPDGYTASCDACRTGSASVTASMLVPTVAVGQ